MGTRLHGNENRSSVHAVHEISKVEAETMSDYDSFDSFDSGSESESDFQPPNSEPLHDPRMTELQHVQPTRRHISKEGISAPGPVTLHAVQFLLPAQGYGGNIKVGDYWPPSDQDELESSTASQGGR